MTDTPEEIEVRFATDSHDIVDVDPPRTLSPWERAILRLLLPSFPSVKNDMDTVRVEAECRHCPSVWFVAEGPGAVYVGQEYGASAILRGSDTDGMFVEVLLLPGEGVLDHLEAWRGDLGNFLGLPEPSSMVVMQSHLSTATRRSGIRADG